MVIEKRKERRIKVALPIKIIRQNNVEAVGTTENISRLGAYLKTDKEIPLGTDIDVILEIPVYTQDLSLGGTINCRGNIFRCKLTRESESKKYYGIGIFFTHFLKPIDREKLSKYIDFLILKDEQDIREGLKHWQGKRDAIKKTAGASKAKFEPEDHHLETVNLLQQILSRLEEISRLLQAQK